MPIFAQNYIAMPLRRILAAFIIFQTLVCAWGANPKREFRGAWLHTVFQDQYHKQTTEQNKAYLCRQLDSLKAAGINAVIFQVRPQADAFYASKIEPWSRFLTDDGLAPEPFWDPLEFMVAEAHSRGMELHAWLNPYRVTSSAKQTLPKGHVYHKYPRRFVRYDGKLYFDPGLPENREYICDVVSDIVRRYDVDGIHLDDYFYPYPVKGKEFDDKASFARYGKDMDLKDWRRRNVDMLIEMLHKRIASMKPWVRFGVSPFGIWRNKTSDPRGSDTNGLENYDSLYADVLLWEEQGWVDYLMPQLYWELDHKAASYRVLNEWWAKNSGAKRHLYIGQDVARTMGKPSKSNQNPPSELYAKMALTRGAENIRGNCMWPGYLVSSNEGGVADSLKTVYHSTLALVPSYPWMSKTEPEPVEKLKVKGRKITWKAAEPAGKVTDVVRYVVYRFDDFDAADISDPAAIVDLTDRCEYTAPRSGVYMITALNRANNESEASNPVLVK